MKMALKVGLLHFCFEDYTIELANGLSKYVDLTLIQPEKVANVCCDSLDSNIKVLTFPKPRIRDPRNFLAMTKMMKIIKELKPDVLHVQETNDPWYDLTMLLNKMPPLVTTIHDVFRHPGDKDLIPGAEYTRRISFYRSQQLIVHSQELQEILIKQFKIQSDHTNVLPHGELGSLFEKRSDYKTIQREPYTILFFGRIWPYKGLKYLIEALPLVAEKIPEVKLLIAGKGENFDELLASIDPKNYELINDYIPSQSVAGLFQRSAAIILPYIESSQSGVASIAYKLGTPVIASNIGGLGEMIKHEKDGLLVPPRDINALAEAIIRLLTDSQLQQKIQQAALERCRQDLNWSNIAVKTLEVYKKAIAN